MLVVPMTAAIHDGRISSEIVKLDLCGPDPFPQMGFEANRKGIELASQRAFEQKIIPRQLSIDEIFDSAIQALN